MVVSVTDVRRLRVNFGKIKGCTVPNLVQSAVQSYERFVQSKVAPEERKNCGLHGLFLRYFPVESNNKLWVVNYKSYRLESFDLTPKDCERRDSSYEYGLYVTFEVHHYKNTPEGTKELVFTCEKEIPFGKIPRSTCRGTFVINGVCRVIIQQFCRAPGPCFKDGVGRIIPQVGSWLDILINNKGLVICKIDTKKKCNATLFPMAMGVSAERLVKYFYKTLECKFINGEWCLTSWCLKYHLHSRLEFDVIDFDTNELIIPKMTKVTQQLIDEVTPKIKGRRQRITTEQILMTYLAGDLRDFVGAMHFSAGAKITKDLLDAIVMMEIHDIEIVNIWGYRDNTIILSTMQAADVWSQKEAIMAIYSTLRPGDMPSDAIVNNVFYNLLSNPKTYSLSSLGRARMNSKLGVKCDPNLLTLHEDDFLTMLKKVVYRDKEQVKDDDIDSLLNKKLLTSGDILESFCDGGMQNIVRNVRERIHALSPDSTNINLSSVISFKPLEVSLRDNMNTSPLSQYEDQTNPLASCRHVRRCISISASGMARDRVGQGLRNVSDSQFGYMCAVETPEGKGLGIILFLALYSGVDEQGSLYTAYYVVDKGVVLFDRVEYLTIEASLSYVVSLPVVLNEDGSFKSEFVKCRVNMAYKDMPVSSVQRAMVSPSQVFSVSTANIPFAEHDAPNRALMGANMQCQALAPMIPSAPLCATPVGAVVARDSGEIIVASRSGEVKYADSCKILVQADERTGEEDSGVDLYILDKWRHGNQNTCVNQRPVVESGEKVIAGDVLADGANTDVGELALGVNVTVAVMSGDGNYEDALIVNRDHCFKDDFTTVIYEEFSVAVRETRTGPEETTKDLPGVSEVNVRNLDEEGIVIVGSKLRERDYMVGKVTSKGEVSVSPEQNLMQALFNQQSYGVKDTSLRVPTGSSGTVVDVTILHAHGEKKLNRAKEIEDSNIKGIRSAYYDEYLIFTDSILERIAGLLVGCKSVDNYSSGATKRHLNDVEKSLLERMLQVNGILWLDDQVRFVEKLLRDKSAIEKDFTASEEDTIRRLFLLLADDFTEDDKKVIRGLPILPRVQIRKNSVLTKEILFSVPCCDWVLLTKEHSEQVSELFQCIRRVMWSNKEKIEKKVVLERSGVSLSPGIKSLIKVGVARVHKLHCGDKLANVHGNKGVVGAIYATEDMPFLEDGTPVGVIINQFSVIARMIAGQSFNLLLGKAARSLLKKIRSVRYSGAPHDVVAANLREFYLRLFLGDAKRKIEVMTVEQILKFTDNLLKRRGVLMSSPVFDGATEQDIQYLFLLADDPNGIRKTYLRDGRTGDYFDQPVMVGEMEIIKLVHMVDQKAHARSTGPYAIVTQQPLPGRAQHGGQRAGHMEYWAMGASGVSAIPQEINAKSDDVVGRYKLFNSLVTGNGKMTAGGGVPEGAKVVFNNLHAMGIQLEFITKDVPTVGDFGDVIELQDDVSSDEDVAADLQDAALNEDSGNSTNAGTSTDTNVDANDDKN